MMAQASCGPQGQMSHGAVEKGLPKEQGSFDCASASLRFALASLWMTELGADDATVQNENPASVEGRACSGIAKS
jgi:hypothetical protein